MLMRWQCVHCEEPLEKDHSFCMGCGRMLEEWEKRPMEQEKDASAPVPETRRRLGRSYYVALGTLCFALTLGIFLGIRNEASDVVQALLYSALLVLFFMTFGFVLKYLLEQPKPVSSNKSTRSLGSALRSGGRRMSGGKRL